MPKIGMPEFVIVLVIVILIFGVGRLGKIGKDLGEGISGFKSALASGEGKESVGEEREAA